MNYRRRISSAVSRISGKSRLKTPIRFISVICLLGLSVTIYYSLSRRPCGNPTVSPPGLIQLDNEASLKVEQRQDQTVDSSKRHASELRRNARAAMDTIEARRNQVTRTCSDGTGVTKGFFLSRSLTSRKHNFLYCPVEKVASTFWRRFLYQLEYTDLRRSPFDVSVPEAYGAMTGRFRVNEEKGPALQNLLDNSTKLLFVRDPFSRLFSAYVDKLLAPNPIYWKNWGNPAIKQFRAGAKKYVNEPCGHDVTFAEFLWYVVSKLWEIEIHTMPVYKICTPCDVNYTVIGKMETFQRDIRHVLSLLNISEDKVSLGRMACDTTDDAIQDSVHDSLTIEWLNDSLKCNSKEEVARRIWRKLQIRGVVSWRMNYNVEEAKITRLKGPEYIEILKEAKDMFRNKTELKLQQSQALLEAFSTVPTPLLTEIVKVFGPDIKLFGYEEYALEMIAKLKEGVKMTGALDWSKNWNLEGVL